MVKRTNATWVAKRNRPLLLDDRLQPSKSILRQNGCESDIPGSKVRGSVYYVEKPSIIFRYRYRLLVPAAKGK